MTFLRELLPCFDRRKQWIPVLVERRVRNLMSQDEDANDKVHQSLRGLGEQSTEVTQFARTQILEPTDNETDDLIEGLKRLADESLDGKDLDQS